MKHIRFWLAAVAVLLGSISVNAHDFESDGIYYNLISSTDFTVAVTFRGSNFNDYSNEYTGVVSIPDTVTYNSNNYRVISIESRAFSGCSSLSSITIPRGVTEIGNYTFEKCTSLKETIIEDGSTILSLGYNYCNSSYGIGEGLFYDCPLEKVYLGRKLSYRSGKSYGYSPFYNKDALYYVAIGDGVNAIADYAFYGCDNISILTINNNVLSIGSNAFSTPKKTIWLTNTPPTGYANAKGNINYVANDQYTSLSNVKVYPYLSSMFEVAGVKYVPVSPAERTCDAIDCVYDKTATVINVCKTVSFKGIDMTINEVKPYTFYGNKHIKEVNVSHKGDIGDYAFYNCDSIQSVELSNEGEVGYQAFYDCDGIKKALVSNKGDVNSEAFKNCDGIQNLELLNGGNVGSQAFYDCDGILTATISNQGNIEAETFSKCSSLEFVKIFNRGYVGARAFSECISLKSAIVDNIASVIGSPMNLGSWTSTNRGDGSISSKTYTFNVEKGANLSFDWFVNYHGRLMITLDGVRILDKSNLNYGVYSEPLDEGEHTLLLEYNNGGNHVYSNGSVQNIIVDYSNGIHVGGVRAEAFCDCTALTTVTLGNSFVALGDKVFSGCTNLHEIIIPDSVKSIGLYCFSDCSAMKNITIGNGVTAIKEFTFQNCTALENVKIGNKVSFIDNYAFSDCSALENIEMGNCIDSINCYAFQNCSSLSNITIPQSVMKIDDNVFSGCSSLADVIIADRTAILNLGSNGSSPLFADCPLDSVYIGGKITYNTTSNMGYSPFYRNTSLRTVVITDREEQIYANEFYGCTNLQNVTIGNGVKSVGNYAFSGCSSLEGFSFGNSMQSIGDEAFSDCTNLTMLISYAEVPPTCGSMALDDINKWECVLRVPQNSLSAYQAADQWKEFFFIEDVLTGINEIEAETEGDAQADVRGDVYSLNGTLLKRNVNVNRLNSILPAGLYVVNGKKVVVK